MKREKKNCFADIMHVYLLFGFSMLGPSLWTEQKTLNLSKKYDFIFLFFYNKKNERRKEEKPHTQRRLVGLTANQKHNFTFMFFFLVYSYSSCKPKRKTSTSSMSWNILCYYRNENGLNGTLKLFICWNFLINELIFLSGRSLRFWFFP